MQNLNTQLRSALAAVLAGLMAGFAPAGLAAAEHVVPAETLTQRLEADAERRAAGERILREVFSGDQARKVLATAGIDAQQASEGVAALGDEELSRLADRARAFQADVAAGALNNQQITYILIALGTAVIILVIVAAD